MNKPIFIMMIGLPASGKSEQAKKLAAKYDAEIFSSDALREEMFGDVNHQTNNDVLFKELHKRIRGCLTYGKSAIYDACNISYKRRMEFLKSLNKIPCEKITVIMATPYEVCLERNAQRERKVPEYVIKRMYMNFNVPFWYEGWDDIDIVYSEGAEGSYGSICDWVESVMNYDQHNSHHTLTLGEHCVKAFMYVYGTPVNFWEITSAALIHDCGKPKCATYINAKGEQTDECHYYNHQFCGSFDSLFFSGIDRHLYVAQLIQWHMRPYLAWEQSDKAMQKDRKLLGEPLFNDICLLHAADVSAHG
jgi:predicted kinase